MSALLPCFCENCGIDVVVEELYLDPVEALRVCRDCYNESARQEEKGFTAQPFGSLFGPVDWGTFPLDAPALIPNFATSPNVPQGQTRRGKRSVQVCLPC